MTTGTETEVSPTSCVVSCCPLRTLVRSMSSRQPHRLWTVICKCHCRIGQDKHALEHISGIYFVTFSSLQNEADIQCFLAVHLHEPSRQWHHFSERMRGCFLRHCAEVANSLWAPRRATKLIWLAVPIRPSKLLGSQSSHNMSQPTIKVKSKNIPKRNVVVKIESSASC